MSQGGVSSPGIVEALDVLEDRTPRYLTVRPRVAVDQLPFNGSNRMPLYVAAFSLAFRGFMASYLRRSAISSGSSSMRWLPVWG